MKVGINILRSNLMGETEGLIYSFLFKMGARFWNRPIVVNLFNLMSGEIKKEINASIYSSYLCKNESALSICNENNS